MAKSSIIYAADIWNRNMKNKKVGKTMIASVAFYGFEIWLLKRYKQRKSLTLELASLRKLARARITKNLKHHHQEQNAIRSISFRQNSKKAT